MSLFLLGIPLAIASMKVLKEDVKYTKMDNQIPKASYNLNEQYRQINKHFADILEYSGAKCTITKKTYGKDISNIKKGEYGGLERYLAEKGYFMQVIDYAKNRFDELAEKEMKIINSKKNTRIDDFEKKLATGNGDMMVVDFNIKYVSYPQYIVEKEVQRTIDYLNHHYNYDVHCNIIMSDGSVPFVNHREVWHIKVPKGESGTQYLQDVYSKLNIEYYKEN